VSAKHTTTRLRARVTEFGYPPVHDALVIGKGAPLGTEAFRRAVNLLVATPFEHVAVEDEVVSGLLVRAAILRRIDADRLVEFVMSRVKPLMAGDEILHLDLEVEVDLEGELG
jgi:hypothetical protein